MKEFVKKLIGRLEELKTFKLNLADAMSELMKKDRLDNYISKEEVIDVVNQLAEEMGISKMENTTWIPCSERLPDKSGKYIVTQERYAIYDSFHTGRKRTEVDYVKFDATDSKWDRARFLKVIAWQPLPEPYREIKNKNTTLTDENICYFDIVEK